MNMIDAGAAEDAVLWQAVQQDDRTAFRTLFDRYGGSLFHTANYTLRDKEASETIVHDIFLNLWTGRHTLDIRHFRQYILTAARYHVYKALKSRKALNLLHGTAGDMEPISPLTVNGGEAKVAEQSMRDSLRQQLNALPKRCREIFLMSREQHLSNQEIAERLNISKRSVENQITYALQHLRVHLKHYSLIALLWWGI
ncbi:RNA polymerase sigma-70 factor [Chitinophaga lutea]